MLLKDSIITVMVKDMDMSIAFYLSLGFTVKERWDDHYAQLKGPGLTLGLHPAIPTEIHNGSGNTSIGFTTDDLEEAKKELKYQNIKFTERNGDDGESLHFNDFDGTALYVIKLK